MIDLRTGKEMTRGGFLKGILASGIAPAITLGALSRAGAANASVGGAARGMMRGVGGRLAAMGEWTNPYVTSGLVAMWDGIWNKSGGVHDSSATTWADLSGSGNDLTCRTNGLFTDDALYCDGSSWSAYRTGRIYYTTVECVFQTKTFTYVKSNTSGERTIFYAGNSSRLLNTPELRIDQFYELNIPRGSVELYSINSTNVKAVKITSNGLKHQICGIYSNNSDGIPSHGYSQGQVSETNTSWNWGVYPNTVVGDRQIDTLGWPWNGWVYAIRLYNRALSASEILSNYQADQRRFNIPAQ